MRNLWWLAALGLAVACESTGAPDDGDLAGGDGGVRSAPGGGARDDGGSAGGGQTTTPADAGPSQVPEDAGSPGTADAGPIYGGCGTLDLAGQWTGTFAGNVWWTSDPNTTEPVSGTLEYTLTCLGQKYGVHGTMTGSESHAVRFTAQLNGEVVPSAQPTMNARMAGEVIFTALAGARVPFTGTMTGAIVGTRVPSGTWQGQSTLAQVPAAGSGTWEAARQ